MVYAPIQSSESVAELPPKVGNILKIPRRTKVGNDALTVRLLQEKKARSAAKAASANGPPDSLEPGSSPSAAKRLLQHLLPMPHGHNDH